MVVRDIVTVSGAGRMGSWMKRALQGAVAVAIAASVPAAWSAGNVQVTNVAAGSAAVSRNGSVTTIRTATPRTIINYSQLSVASGETLRFVQPTATSSVLNRIQSTMPTTIEGALLSNGRVYLVNPAGIMFGKGAVINVGQLYAAAGNMTDKDFLAGSNRFINNAGRVENYGTIQAGQVHLVGQYVANFGTIVVADAGVVTMTAGKEVYIGESNSPTGQAGVLVKVSSDTTAKAGTAVTNAGTVAAPRGQLALGAGDLYAAGIYNSGSLKGARITLSANKNTAVTAGTIDASNNTGKGGSVEITGAKTGVFAGTVDASGATGGGTIKVGGDFHGAAGVQASNETVVGPTAVIKADALVAGDGGQVAVWSDGFTRFEGSIAAQGAGLAGVGGFVEVSGKAGLSFGGMVNVLGPAGAGTVLLDPDNVTIAHSGGTLTGDSSFSGNTVAFGGGGSTTISDFKINSLSGTIIIQADKVITINGTADTGGAAVINLTGSNSIQIQAGQDLVMHAGSSITTQTGFISLTSGDAGGAPKNNGNDLTVTSLTSHGGSITLLAQSVGAFQTSTIKVGTVNAGSGQVIVQANAFDFTGASITTTGTVFLEPQTVSMGINVSSSSSSVLDIKPSDLAKISDGATVKIGDDAQRGNVTVTQTDLSAKQFALLSVNAGTTVNAGTLTLDDGGSAGLLHNGPIFLAGRAMLAGGTANNTKPEVGTTGNQSITLVAGVGGIGAGASDPFEIGGHSVVTLTSGADAFVHGVGSGADLRLGAATAVGQLWAKADNNVAGGGTLTASTVTLTAVSGAIGSSGLPVLLDSTVQVSTLTSGGNIDVTTNAASMTTSLTMTGAGAGTLTLQRAGAYTIDGPIVASGGLLVIHGGTDGVGNLAFTGKTINADKVSLRAGTLTTGALTTSAVDLTTAVIKNFANTGAPASFEIQQDVTFAEVPDLSGVTGTVPQTLSYRSAQGSVGLSVAGRVAGSSLTLAGATGVTIATALTAGNAVASLTTVGDTSINGDITTAGAISVTGKLTAAGPSALQASGLTVSGDAVINGDVTTTGGVSSFGGNLQIKAATLITAGTLTVAGTVSSEATQKWALTTNVTGATSFNGGFASTLSDELGALSTSGGTISIGNGGAVTVAVVGGDISIGQDLALGGDTTFRVDVPVTGNVTFGGKIDGGFALGVNTSGLTWFKGDVGTGTRLTSVTTTGGGAVELGGASAFTMKVTNAVGFGGAVTLVQDTAIDGGANGTVTFGSTVDGAFGLTVTTDAAIAFQSDVGGGTRLTSLTLHESTLGAGGQVSFSGGSTPFLVKTTGAQDLAQKQIALTKDVTFDASVGGDVTLGLLSGPHAVTVNTTGVTWFFGGATGLTTLGTTGGGAVQFGNTGGAITVETTVGQSYGGTVVLKGDTAFKAPALAFNFIDPATHNLTLQATDITLNQGAATFTSAGGVVTVMPYLDTDAIVIGSVGLAAGTLYVSRNDIVAYEGAFSAITIGSANVTATHAITIQSDNAGLPVEFDVPVTIRGQAGTITVEAPGNFAVPGLFGTGAGGITLGAQTVFVHGDIQTNGQAIAITGDVNANGLSVLIKSHDGASGTFDLANGAVAGAITITGNIYNAFDVFLDAGGTTTRGNVTLQGSVGNILPPFSFHVKGDQFTLGGSIDVIGSAGATPAVNLDVNTMVLAASAVTITTGPNGFAFTGSTITGTGGPVDLVIDASGAAGGIDLGGAVLDGTLRDVTLTSAGGNQVGTGTLAGAFQSNGVNFTLNGPLTAAGVTINHSGAVDIKGAIDSVNGSSVKQAVGIDGTTVTIESGATVTASTVTINHSGDLNINAQITADGGFTSTGSGTAAFFLNAGGITTVDSAISISTPGAATLNAPLNAGNALVSVSANGIQQGSTIDAGSLDLNANASPLDITGVIAVGGSVTLAGSTLTISAAVTGSTVSLSSANLTTIDALVTGVNGITTTGNGVLTIGATGGLKATNGVTSGPITINHLGLVTISGSVDAGTGDVAVSGDTIVVNTGATIDGGAISFTDVNGIQIDGVVTGGSITSTGTSTLTLGGTLSTSAANGSITITHTGDLVTLNGPVDAGDGTVAITGLGISTGTGGSISGGSITLDSGTGTATIAGAINASKLFVSTGTGTSAFILASTGAITTSNDTVTITHGGSIALSGAINAGTGAIDLTGHGITDANTTAPITGGAITLDPGTGDVVIGSAVNGSGAFRSTGSLTSSFLVRPTGSISTSNGANVTVTHTLGTVTLNGAVSAAGNFVSTGVDFTNAASVAGANITVNHTGTVTLNQALNAGTGFLSVKGQSIVSNANGTLNAGNGTLTATGASPSGLLHLNGPVTFGTGGLIGTGTDITTKAITARGVTLTSTGALALGGALSSAGHAVNLTGNTIVVNTGAPITGAAITFTDKNGIQIYDTVTGSSITSTLTAGGSSAFTLGTLTSGALTTTGNGAILLFHNGAVTLNGPIHTGSGALTVRGNNITTGTRGTLTAGAGTFIAIGGGAILVQAPVTLSGDLLATAGTISNTRRISAASISMTAGNSIALGADLVTAGNATLTANTAGITQSAGAVTASTLQLNGTGDFVLTRPNAIATLMAHVSGLLNFTNQGGFVADGLTAGQVILTANTGNLTINGEPNGIIAGDIRLTASTGNLLINAFVSGADVQFSAVQTSLAADVTATTGITVGDAQIVGSRTLTSTGTLGITLGSVTGANLSLITTAGTAPIAIGQVGSAGDRFGDLLVTSSNTTELKGDITAHNVTFAGNGATTPTSATIFADTKDDADATRTINVSGAFEMKVNQKFSVFDSGVASGQSSRLVGGVLKPAGNLTIEYSVPNGAGSLTLGDLSVLGRLVLNSGSINGSLTFVNRTAQSVQLSNNSFSTDKGTDIVVGDRTPGAITMIGTVFVVNADTNRRIQFVSSTISADLSTDTPANVGKLRYSPGSLNAIDPLNGLLNTPLTQDQFFVGANPTPVLDIVATGVPGTIVQNAVLIPRDVQTLQPERAQAISGALRDALRELGIYARDLHTYEIIEYLVGRALYDDVPYKLDPAPTENEVASNRLPYSPVLPTVDAYRHLFFKPELDDKGEQVMVNGKPKLVSQEGAIQKSLGQSWLAYSREKGEEATPGGFRGYLEAHEKDDPKFAAALDNLNQFRDLLAMIKRLGLTDNEFKISRNVLVTKVRPPNIKEEDFLDVVNGPSTRAAGLTASK